MTNPETQPHCPVCYAERARVEKKLHEAQYEVDCPRCGRFDVSTQAARAMDELTEGRRLVHLLMGLIRENSDAGRTLYLSTSSVPVLVAAAHPPKSIFESIDRLLTWVEHRSQSPADTVQLDPPWHHPILYARDAAEFTFYVQKAKEIGFLELLSNMNTRLTVDGWRRLSELRRLRPLSNQAFVAMWFAEELNDFSASVSKALRDSGYDPIRMDLIQHNDRIDDRILSEIRKSGLLVADFTGSRGGVYFEAGFALGLGIRVIWMCRNTDVERLHFDTRQYNHIVWTSAGDAYEQLRLRIEATVPFTATSQ